MDDKDKFAITDTFVPYKELTITPTMRKKIIQLRLEVERLEAEQLEAEEREAEE